MKFNMFENELSDSEKAQMPFIEKVGGVALEHENGDLLLLVSPKNVDEYLIFKRHFADYVNERSGYSKLKQRFSIFDSEALKSFQTYLFTLFYKRGGDNSPPFLNLISVQYF